MFLKFLCSARYNNLIEFIPVMPNFRNLLNMLI